MKNFLLKNIKTLIVICLLVSLGSVPYSRRYILLNTPDVYDYKKLPARTIHNDPSVLFNFRKASQFNLNAILPFGYNSTIVNDLDSALQNSGTTAFLLIRNDTILYERYFGGHDQTTLCKSFSASKVFISALIGIAIDEGLIKSVNDPVMNYITDIKDKRFAGLTIHHCLSLTSGIKSTKGQIFPWDDKVRIYYSSNLRRLLTRISYDHESGKEYSVEEYSPVLLAMVLEKATGKTVSRYLEEKIWRPLGMSHNALWVTDKRNNGFEAANSGLTATPADFARFGRLYLNNGRFNNLQVISQKWIHESTMADTSSVCFWRKIEYYNKKDVYFNSMWWGLRAGNTEYSYSASGHFGQRIFISPSKNTIALRFGTKEGKIDWTGFMMNLVEKL